jgi:solute carrier family 34 (sodium-dependent phosphate cotransporter)
MVTSGTTPLQVALAHLFFNLSGIVLFYPVPFMRQLPLNGARFLGKMTKLWRGFPVVYIVVAFFVVPAILLGISLMFTNGSKGMTVLGSFIVATIVLGGGWSLYSLKYRGGKERWVMYFKNREIKSKTYESLPQDMVDLKEKTESFGTDIAKLQSMVASIMDNKTLTSSI